MTIVKTYIMRMFNGAEVLVGVIPRGGFPLFKKGRWNGGVLGGKEGLILGCKVDT